LVAAALVSSLAILVKPFGLFTILGAFISLAIYKKADWKRTIDSDFLIFTAILFLPITFYYSYGIIVSGFLSNQAQVSFLPYLLLTREYWKGWLLTASSAFGYTPLIAALLGLSMLRKGSSRALLVGLWLGYAVFCMIFTYHIRFTRHYHTQLIVIVALSAAPIAGLVIKNLRQLSNKWYWWLPSIGALMLMMLFNIREVQRDLAASRKYESVEVAQEIGDIIDHSSQTVYVAPYYGMPLEYYGELSGTYWPRRITNMDWVRDRQDGSLDQSGTKWTQRIVERVLWRPDERELSIEERVAALGFPPEYFVITDFERFNRHHADLKEYLVNHCSLVAERDQYLIYGNCTH
jgi:hypothetical protein